MSRERPRREDDWGIDRPDEGQKRRKHLHKDSVDEGQQSRRRKLVRRRDENQDIDGEDSPGTPAFGKRSDEADEESLSGIRSIFDEIDGEDSEEFDDEFDPLRRKKKKRFWDDLGLDYDPTEWE